MKRYWEIIADNLSKAGWSLDYVSALDCEGRTIWITDAHRGDGKRFIVRADEKLAAFLELEAATRGPYAALRIDTPQQSRSITSDHQRRVTTALLFRCGTRFESLRFYGYETYD